MKKCKTMSPTDQYPKSAPCTTIRRSRLPIVKLGHRRSHSIDDVSSQDTTALPLMTDENDLGQNENPSNYRRTQTRLEQPYHPTRARLPTASLLDIRVADSRTGHRVLHGYSEGF